VSVEHSHCPADPVGEGNAAGSKEEVITPSHDPHLRVGAAPFLTRGVTTPSVMRDVLFALTPVVIGSAYYFGLAAILILTSTVLGAVCVEWLFNRKRFRLADGSVLVTGLLLGLTLPPTLPLWIAFLGGFVAIGLGRLIWGGLGQNPFNPALVGRAFLQAAFPTALTTWRAPGDFSTFFELPNGTFAAPFMKVSASTDAGVDAVSTATPLATMKFEHVSTDVWQLVSGDVGGSLGETTGLLIVIGGLYLIARRAMDWRIPVSIFVTVAVFAGILYGIDSARYASPWFMLGSGGLLLGAVYMATDPVTSPMAPRGVWIFGIGVGLLVVLIRVWGGLPEGVMYAILLMNAATPLIDRYVQPKPFGRERHS
jgi:electron transport complex protein RnfD